MPELWQKAIAVLGCTLSSGVWVRNSCTADAYLHLACYIPCAAAAAEYISLRVLLNGLSGPPRAIRPWYSLPALLDGATPLLSGELPMRATVQMRRSAYVVPTQDRLSDSALRRCTAFTTPAHTMQAQLLHCMGSRLRPCSTETTLLLARKTRERPVAGSEAKATRSMLTYGAVQYATLEDAECLQLVGAHPDLEDVTHALAEATETSAASHPTPNAAAVPNISLAQRLRRPPVCCQWDRQGLVPGSAHAAGLVLQAQQLLQQLAAAGDIHAGIAQLPPATALHVQTRSQGPGADQRDGADLDVLTLVTFGALLCDLGELVRLFSCFMCDQH